MRSPTASTLIHGERDAVLVDPGMTVDEPRARTDWVVTTGKNVIAPFVTSPPVVQVPRSRRRCRPFARLVNEVREQWLRDLVVAGRARPGRIVTHHGRLEDAPGLYQRFDQRADGVIKAVLQPA
jgi:threonine dehydrogenase-like Zn-dependent dehydrogenase